MRKIVLFSTGLIFMAGCATTPGAHPHDMSEAAHDQAAAEQSSVATQHQAQYDPAAMVVRNRCRALITGGGQQVVSEDVCWTSVSNPTDFHLQQAAEHRRMAADHRAASTALRDAEATACVGISADDRDISPFEHVEDIDTVESLTETTNTGKSPARRLLGATISFRPVPGMTAGWLQRAVDCHLARNASLGHVVPEMPNCPLVLKGVEARVTSTENGLVVTIRSNHQATAKEILERAQRTKSATTATVTPPAL